MAKKKENNVTEEGQRQSRKEILRARKQQEQLRTIRLGVGIVVALVVVVVAVALVNEYVIAPNRAVATVNGVEIALGEWQERVRFERAQRIIALENQLELFGGDVGPIQQFAGQTINELVQGETLGEQTLNEMVNEEIVRQGAAERGIDVTDEEVSERIGELFNFYGGAVPTPEPTATETMVPTPSITPIPTAVITDVVPTETPFPTPTLGPTETPLPTATPVSEEAFLEEYNSLVDRFQNLGVSEETYRSVIQAQMVAERLTDALVEEQNFTGEAEQVSAYVLTFTNEEEAQQAEEAIRESDFLTVWNTIRSTPPDPEATEPPTARANEILWRTQESLAQALGQEVADVAFTLPPGVPSAVITTEAADGTTQYVLLSVSGREVRPLSANEREARRQQILNDYVNQVFVTSDVEVTDVWRGRVPTVPVLDARFLAPPTPTPEQPAVPALPETGDGAEPGAGGTNE